MFSDVTALFGEAWCVALAPLPVAEALHRTGVDGPAELPDGMARVTERLEAGCGSFPDVLLLGRGLAGGWSLVLELEGCTGWVCLAPGVLESLSRGGTAACARADPNQVTVHFAGPGGAAAQLDATSGRRSGDFGEGLGRALTAAGFPAGDGGVLTGEAAELDVARRSLLALRAATGVTVTDAVLAGPWTGGTSAL